MLHDGWEADAYRESRPSRLEIADQFRDYGRDVLWMTAGWCLIANPVADQGAILDVNDCTLNAGATDVDSDCLLAHA
jgi:hypothetical protein